MSRDNYKQVGVTSGLAVTTCDKTIHAIEQGYVWIDDSSPTHPVLVEGWIGYSTVVQMRLTKAQATDMIGLLAQAVAKL